MSDHFSGKEIPEHLKEARKKGFEVQEEIHGRELSGFLSALTDSAKETILLLSLLFLVLKDSFFHAALFILPGWVLWKWARSTLLGTARLKKLHRLIEEEKWEITHHRKQEREELMALYQVKGFASPLLEQVVDVLMADDNRLLKVMLEEELGLSLEVYEHPIRQGVGAFLGGLIAAVFSLSGFFFFERVGFFFVNILIFTASTYFFLKQEKSELSSLVIWNLSSFIFVIILTYLLV